MRFPRCGISYVGASVTKFGLIIAMLIVTEGAAAGPFEDGVAAYNNHDFGSALSLFRSLAERGDARSEVYLGYMFGIGEGVAQDDSQATKWFRLAAD